MDNIIIIFSIFSIFLSIIACVIGIWAIVTKRDLIYKRKLEEFEKQKEQVIKKIEEIGRDFNDK